MATWTTPSDRSTGDTITSSIWNENSGASGNSALLKTSVNNSGALSFVDATELTIASGVITVTGNYHKIDTEGSASSDDVDTITAGANIVAGHVLHLRVESDARTVVLKNGTSGADNLDIGADVTLDEAYKTYSLVYDGTNWRPFTFAESPTFASLSPLTTRGDLLVATTTVTGVRLGIGSATYVLTSDGTDAAWAAAAGGGFPFLDKATLTSGELQTGTISLAASGCLVVFQNVEVDTDDVSLHLLINGATSGYEQVQRLSRIDGNYGYGGNPTDALYLDCNIPTHGRLGNATGEQAQGHVYLSSDGTYLNWHGLIYEQNANGDPTVTQVAGNLNLGGAITSITMAASSGDIDGGEMMVYDIKES